MTANANEMREIAADHHAGTNTLMQRYADLAEINPGLSQEVRYKLQELSATTSIPRRRIQPGDFSAAFRLGKLLGHVAPLEDRLNTERACPESPTGWHEWANNEQCCHCGKDAP